MRLTLLASACAAALAIATPAQAGKMVLGGNTSNVDQSGNGQQATVKQPGSNDTSSVVQSNSGNTTTVTQTGIVGG